MLDQKILRKVTPGRKGGGDEQKKKEKKTTGERDVGVVDRDYCGLRGSSSKNPII